MATAYKAERYDAPEERNLPVERATINQIEANREKALNLFEQAFDLLQAAGDAANSASISGMLPNATYFRGDLERYLVPTNGQRAERREKFLTGVRETLDRAIWRHLIDATDLERLMDHQARDEFRKQLDENPPEATAENCYATLSNLAAQADEIFKRGIANAFSKLDRRFRSHDGFKVGSRLVLDHALSEYGTWNHYARKDEIIRDVERTFYVLDDKEVPPRHVGIVGAIDSERGGLAPKAFVVTSEYFEARVFKNGNIHLWFTRKDLLEKVNRLLAEYYGETLGAGADATQNAAQESFALRPRETHARNFGFFPTSEEVAQKVLEIGEMTRIDQDATILEPSAGTGSLIEAVLAAGAVARNITAIEIQNDFCSQLRALGLGKVINENFLKCDPTVIGQFDVVLMNPPFDRSLDCDHVLHAMKFVKPGGKLVAIMAAGVEYRDNARAKAVSRHAADWNAIWYDAFRDLPERSFAHAGTNVNTCVLAIKKPEN